MIFLRKSHQVTGLRGFEQRDETYAFCNVFVRYLFLVVDGVGFDSVYRCSLGADDLQCSSRQDGVSETPSGSFAIGDRVANCKRHRAHNGEPYARQYFRCILWAAVWKYWPKMGVAPGPNVANPNGTPTLSPVGLENLGDPDHSHENGFSLEYNFGSNNGWANEPVHCPRGYQNCALPTAYSYVPANETTTYRTIAERFAIADNVFQGNEGPSFVAHQYLISGQSGGTGSGSLTKPFAMAENAKNGAGGLDDVVPTPVNGSVDPVFEAQIRLTIAPTGQHKVSERSI